MEIKACRECPYLDFRLSEEIWVCKLDNRKTRNKAWNLINECKLSDMTRDKRIMMEL